MAVRLKVALAVNCWPLVGAMTPIVGAMSSMPSRKEEEFEFPAWSVTVIFIVLVLFRPVQVVPEALKGLNAVPEAKDPEVLQFVANVVALAAVAASVTVTVTGRFDVPLV